MAFAEVSRPNPEGFQPEIWQMPASGSDLLAKVRKLVACDAQTGPTMEQVSGSIWQLNNPDQ